MLVESEHKQRRLCGLQQIEEHESDSSKTVERQILIEISLSTDVVAVLLSVVGRETLMVVSVNMAKIPNP